MNNKFFKFSLLIFVACFSCAQVSAGKMKKSKLRFVKKFLLSNPGLTAATFAAGYGLSKFDHGELSKLTYMYASSFCIETIQNILEPRNFSRRYYLGPPYKQSGYEIDTNANYIYCIDLPPALDYIASKIIFGKNKNSDLLFGFLIWAPLIILNCTGLFVRNKISCVKKFNSCLYKKAQKKAHTMDVVAISHLFLGILKSASMINFFCLFKDYGKNELAKISLFYVLNNAILSTHSFIWVINSLLNYHRAKIISECKKDDNCNSQKQTNLTVNSIFLKFITLFRYATPALTYLAAKKILNVQPAGAV